MSFQQGLSGLSAAAKNLEVIGNNLANANTIGSKVSRAEFGDLFASVVGGNASVGIGTRVAAVSQDFTQGSLTTTGNNLDLALNGTGFFQMRSADTTDSNGTAGEIFYSRNGQMKVDRNGFIVNNDGMRLLGYQADADGNILAGQLSDLRIPPNLLAPEQTSRVDIQLNLDSLDSLVTTPTFSPSDGSSFNYGTSVKVYDASGREVDVGLYFKKRVTGAGPTLNVAWDVYGTANGIQFPPASVGPLVSLNWTSADGSAPPTATANATPVLVPGTEVTTPTGVNGISIPAKLLEDTLNNGAPSLTPTNSLAAASGNKFNFNSSAVVIDFTQSSQRASDYLVDSVEQDGSAVGTLSSFSFDRSGILTARYTNGEAIRTGQIALATYTNLNGLIPTGGNNWSETRDAGTKVVDTPGVGIFGEVLSGTLEESNVDITEELVNLITAQRTYQANAQTIKTQDQVLQTFINR